MKKRVFIIFGSRSDYNDEIKAICEDPTIGLEIAVHVISCHRNPQDIKDLFSVNLIRYLLGCDWLIGAGSKALALPGILDAWSYYFSRRTGAKMIPVAGVALGKPGSQDLIDAQRSIMGLPGQPVIFDGAIYQAYTGPQGLKKLLSRIANSDPPPEKPRKEKPAEYFIFKSF